jgi:hypothetical protein
MTEHEQLGDAPIEEKYQAKMVAIARLLDDIFNEGAEGKDRPTGFVLMVYPFVAFDSGDSRCNYLSNGANRQDVVTLMKEMISRFEGQPEITGQA